MQIHYGTENFPLLFATIVTAGTFDGVHLGHQKILNRLHETARKTNRESVVITYHPHPRIVLGKDKDLKLLTTLDEKITLLEKAGVNHLVIVSFNKEFSELSSEEFIQEILIKKLHTTVLIIGYDHRFGKNREGSFEYLKENSGNYGFEIEEIPAQEIDEITVSSSKIRKALTEGNITLANELLQRPYTLSGTVVKGKQLGRTIGYPTANIEIADTYKLVPADGVYAVVVEYENSLYRGMLSIGTNPTVNGSHRTIEVNILDFEGDLYGKELTLGIIKFVRGQIKFPGLSELIQQIQQDEIVIRKMLEEFSVNR
jgi:riboflavin kinase/FMN adenylyltransferase